MRLLGVFDTVGALGVPGAVRSKHQFHDVSLGARSSCARARHWRSTSAGSSSSPACGRPTDDDPRRADEKRPGRAGLVRRRALRRRRRLRARPASRDTTLLWMADEAKALGLVFDQRLLDVYVGSGGPRSPAQLAHRRPTGCSTWRLAGPDGAHRHRHGGSSGGWRRLDPPPRPDQRRAVGVRIATFTAEALPATIPTLRHDRNWPSSPDQTDGFTGVRRRKWSALPGADALDAGCASTPGPRRPPPVPTT